MNWLKIICYFDETCHFVLLNLTKCHTIHFNSLSQNGFDVVKPNISILIDNFSFFVFGEPNWIDYLVLSLGEFDVFSIATCIVNSVISSIKGLNTC